MNKVLPILCMISIFTIYSCCDSDTTDSIVGLHENMLKSLTQTFEIDIDENSTSHSLETDAGCRIWFPSSSFTYQGNEVVGKINIDVIEIFDKGTMALTGMTTTAGNEILISGGEFFIRAYQEENELDFEGTYSIRAPIYLTGNYSDEMTLFDRVNDPELGETWSLVGDSTNSLRVRLAEGSEDYAISLEGFGWFNCDRFMNDPRFRLPLNIKVPAAYDNENSVVFFAIKTESSSLGDAIGFPIPRGLGIHLIFIADSDDDFLYQIISTTASHDEEYVFERIKMNEASEKELIDIINDLE